MLKKREAHFFSYSEPDWRSQQGKVEFDTIQPLKYDHQILIGDRKFVYMGQQKLKCEGRDHKAHRKALSAILRYRELRSWLKIQDVAWRRSAAWVGGGGCLVCCTWLIRGARMWH